MSHADNTGVGKGEQMRLRNIYEDRADVMEALIASEEFCSADLDVDKHAYRSTIKQLEAVGAVHRIGQRQQHYENGWDLVHEWRWESPTLKRLREYVEDRDRLPCGHRAHIHHRDGKYGCQYCDVERDYSKETVLAVMDA